MTSRRKFLGLLAAAPVVGPEMVKAAVSEADGFGVARFLRGTSMKPYVYGRIPNFEPSIVGPDFKVYGTVDTAFEMSPEAFKEFELAMQSASVPNDALRQLLRSQSPWDAPNRLYGSYVNEDGDAI